MLATPDDIRYCFRLLLGREPNEEEIPGHYSLAGAPLDSVVASYLQSLEFRNRGLLQPNATAELIKLDRFSIYVAPDDQLIAPGIRTANYEPEVTECFRRHVKRGQAVIDIGANCGWFSLLAYSLGASEVYAFEPLQRNVRMLMASRAVNSYELLHVIPAAAWDQAGSVSIGASWTNGIVNDPDSRNMTPEALLSADYAACVRVDDTIPEDLPVCLIKIDVEGNEFTALKGATGLIERQHPAIVSEFQPSDRDYIEWLEERGYRVCAVDSPTITGWTSLNYHARGRHHIDILAVTTNSTHQT